MMAFPAATTRPTTTLSFHLTSTWKPNPRPPKLTSSSLLAKPSSIHLSCACSIDVSKEDSPTQQQEQPPQQLPEENTGAEASAQAFDKRRLEEKFAVLNTGIYECRSCGYKYDESLGDPLYPIPPGLQFNKMPEDWRCPTCGAAKSFFESKSVEIAGFAQNQQFGFGTNTLTSGQKAILIYVSSDAYMSRQMRREDSGENSEVVQAPIVEVLNPSTYDNYAAGVSRSPFSDLWSRVMRIKITGRDGLEKLDLRIPVGLLNNITNIVPDEGLCVRLKSFGGESSFSWGDNWVRWESSGWGE